MERVKHEMTVKGHLGLSHLNAQQILEKYRQEVSALRSLVQSDDFEEAEALIMELGRTTPSERAVLEALRK